MPFSDLDAILQVVKGGTYSGDVSTQASALYSLLSGETAEFQISTGSQVQPLPPTISYPVLNTVSWSNNMPAEYQSIMTATFGGTTVTPPLAIPEGTVDEALVITISAEGFKDRVTTVLLNYVQAGGVFTRNITTGRYLGDYCPWIELYRWGTTTLNLGISTDATTLNFELVDINPKQRARVFFSEAGSYEIKIQIDGIWYFDQIVTAEGPGPQPISVDYTGTPGQMLVSITKL